MVAELKKNLCEKLTGVPAGEGSRRKDGEFAEACPRVQGGSRRTSASARENNSQGWRQRKRRWAQEIKTRRRIVRAYTDVKHWHGTSAPAARTRG